MLPNWLFANRISRRPVATWEDCVGPASLRTAGLQSRGNVGICALMRCGCRINSAGRGPGVFGFVSALESRYQWKRLTDLCVSSRPTPVAGPVRNPEQPEFSPPRYGQSAPFLLRCMSPDLAPTAAHDREQTFAPNKARSEARAPRSSFGVSLIGWYNDAC
jgi:hypothetical protein